MFSVYRCGVVLRHSFSTFKKKRLYIRPSFFVESIFHIAISTLAKFTSHCKNRVENVKAAVITMKKPKY